MLAKFIDSVMPFSGFSDEKLQQGLCDVWNDRRLNLIETTW